VSQNASNIFGRIRVNQRLSQEIAERIKAAIFDKKLIPGDRLPPEKELARVFGTSRTTAREAIRLLETSGMLMVKPGQDGGVFVIQPDIGPVQKIILDLIKTKQLTIAHFTDARMILEPNIAEAIMDNITKEEIELLEQNVTEAEKELEKEKPRNVSLNIEFHKILIQSARNPLLSMVLGLIFDILKTYLRSLKADKEIGTEVVNHHREILETIKRGDPGRLRELMVEHIRNVNNNLKILE
jgi:GntR family transcriptional repressor for pyruvate dehydrogenase complex